MQRLNILRSLMTRPAAWLLFARDVQISDLLINVVDRRVVRSLELLEYFAHQEGSHRHLVLEYIRTRSDIIGRLNLEELVAQGPGQATDQLLDDSAKWPGFVLRAAPDLIACACLLTIYEIVADALVLGEIEFSPVLARQVSILEAAMCLDPDRLLADRWRSQPRLADAVDYTVSSAATKQAYLRQVWRKSEFSGLSEEEVLDAAHNRPSATGCIGPALFEESGQDRSASWKAIGTMAICFIAAAAASGGGLFLLHQQGLAGGPLMLAFLGLQASTHESIDYLRRLGVKAFARQRDVYRTTLEFLEEASARCVIAVPTIAMSEDDLKPLIGRFTSMIQGLSPRIFRLALLVDPPDQSSAADADVAEACMEELHQKFSQLQSGKDEIPVVLLTRGVIFSPAEECWLAKGRKSGKLRTLMEMMSGRATDFKTSINADCLDEVEYVVIVDDDTVFRPEDIISLMRSAVHPMNAAVQDGAVFRPQAAISPFLAAVSNDYDMETAGYGKDPAFEVFGNRQFSGRGLIHRESWLAMIAPHAPEDYVLSHDVLEGAHLGVHLDRHAVFRDLSYSQHGDSRRVRERWARGDVQNLLELLTTSKPYYRRLPPFGIYLILDNARTALLPLIQIIGVLGAALSPDANAFIWITLVIGAAPVVCETIASLGLASHRILNGEVRRAFSAGPRGALALKAAVRRFVDLPLDGAVAAVALARALVRVASRRRLLQWTASSLERSRSRDTDVNVAWWALFFAVLPAGFGIAVGTWPPILLGALWTIWAVCEVNDLRGWPGRPASTAHAD